jgi:hypothetical protein
VRDVDFRRLAVVKCCESGEEYRRHRRFRLVANQFFVLSPPGVSDSPPVDGITARCSLVARENFRTAEHFVDDASVNGGPATNEVP